MASRPLRMGIWLLGWTSANSPNLLFDKTGQLQACDCELQGRPILCGSAQRRGCIWSGDFGPIHTSNVSEGTLIGLLLINFVSRSQSSVSCLVKLLPRQAGIECMFVCRAPSPP